MSIPISKKQIQEHLVDIEAKLPKREYPLYEATLSFYPTDIISVQKEAKKMMEFVGLFNFTTTITFETLSGNVGGNINLNNSKEVFISINSDAQECREICLATLAHEICHKLLYVYSLYYQSFDNLNEVYADLATIFVGFGALTLNGCHVKDKRIGYLTMEDYAYAYYLVNASKNTDYYIYSRVLSGESLKALTYIRERYAYPIEQRQFLLNQRLTEYATLYKNITIIEQWIEEYKQYVVEKKYVERINSQLSKQQDFTEIKKSISFINEKIYISENDDMENVLKLLTPFILQQKNIVTNINENIKYIKCPVCGKERTTKIDFCGLKTFKCPCCSNVFTWDSEGVHDTIETKHTEESASQDTTDHILKKRLKNFLGKMNQPPKEGTSNILLTLYILLIASSMIILALICI